MQQFSLQMLSKNSDDDDDNDDAHLYAFTCNHSIVFIIIP